MPTQLTRRDALRAALGSAVCASAVTNSACTQTAQEILNNGHGIYSAAILAGLVSTSAAPLNYFDPNPGVTAPASVSPKLVASITAAATAPLAPPSPPPQLASRLAKLLTGPFAYLLNNTNQEVDILDLGSGNLTSHIPLTNSTFSPGVIALTPDGQSVLVATHDSGQNPRLLVVSLFTEQITATIPLAASGTPNGIALTPDGQFAYITANLQTTPGVVWLADVVNAKFVTAISIPSSARSAVVSPDGSSVYVATTPTAFNKQTGSDQEMTVIDTLTNTAAVQINFPNGSFGLDKVAISPNGRHVYATSNGPNVAVIDAVTNTFSSLIKVAPAVSGVTRLALTPDGRYLYTLDQGDLNLNLIDAGTGTLVSRTPALTATAGQTWNLFELFLTA